MKPLPHNADLLSVAPRVVWFEPRERALADPVRFLVHVMTYDLWNHRGNRRGAPLRRTG
jgi:hypothetical protein